MWQRRYCHRSNSFHELGFYQCMTNPAIHVDRLPRHIVRRRRQEDHQRGDVFRCLPAAEGNDSANLFAVPFLVGLAFLLGLLTVPRLPDDGSGRF